MTIRIEPKTLRHLILLTVLVGCCITLSANDSVDTPTDSTISSGQTDTISAPAGATEQSLYPMSPERKEKLIAYSNFKNIWRFAEFFIGLGILSLILFTGLAAKMRNWAQAAKIKFFVVWLFLILFIVVEYVISLPFHIYRGFIVESNYGFMNQTFIQWLADDLLGLLIGVVIGIIPMWFLYSLINKTRRWWAWFAVGAVPFLVFFIVIAPVVISPHTGLPCFPIPSGFSNLPTFRGF